MVINIYICMYMSLFDRISREHSYEGMIFYVGEWHEEVLGPHDIDLINF